MADQQLTIGESINIKPTTTTSSATPLRMTVVGTTIINDSDENSRGRGGVVARQWVERFSPEVTPDPYVIRLVAGADRARVQAQLERHVPGSVNGALLQGAIRNVVRIRQIPLLLTGLVIVLAVTSLGHAWCSWCAVNDRSWPC